MNPAYEEIKNILVNKYDVPVDKINYDVKLIDLIDSVDRMYLLLDMKKKYNVEILSSELAGIVTIRNFSDLLTSKVDKQ